MGQAIVPMLHVPDVKETAFWYQSIGFSILDIGEDSGKLVWALLSYLGSTIMLSAGGELSMRGRRDVDLYIHAENIGLIYSDLKDRVKVQEPPHITFYGMREFIVRDNNGFWITFGEPAKA